jgi:hypothetical protein
MKTTTRHLIEELATKLGYRLYPSLRPGDKLSEAPIWDGEITKLKEAVHILKLDVANLRKEQFATDNNTRWNETLIWRLVSYFGLTLTTSETSFVRAKSTQKRSK